MRPDDANINLDNAGLRPATTETERALVGARRRGRPKGSTVANGAKKPRRCRTTGPGSQISNGPAPLIGTIKIKCGSLTAADMNVILDRVLCGESISSIASEIGADSKVLTKKLRRFAGLTYMRTWQNTVKYDCLRVEMIIRHSFAGINDEIDGPKWAAIALKALEYRARVLGYGAISEGDTTLRVAGMNQEQIFDAVSKLV